MLRLMTWISLRLGRAPARFVLAGISLYFLLFAPAAKAASRAYLRRALDREPTFADLFRHFHSFASTIHDRVFLLNARFDLFQVEVQGEDVIEEVLAAGRGAFLMGAHMGSFEVVRAIGRRQPGLRVAMVMYEENARKLNAALAAINPAAVQDIIPLGQLDSMLRVQASLDEGMVLGVLGDRTLGGDPTLRVPFLGRGRRVSDRPHAPGRHAEAAGAVHERPLSGRQSLRHPLRAAGRFQRRRAAGARCRHPSPRWRPTPPAWNAIAAPPPTTGSTSSISGARRMLAKT